MRTPIVFAACIFLGFAPKAAMAQAPDCRVLLLAANTAHHAGEIVVASSTQVTLEVHCLGAAQPTYRWGTGQTTFAITVAAASAAGTQQSYAVDVTLNGLTRSLTGTVRTAAAGTPTCALSREPAGDVAVFTTVRITAFCTGASAYDWTGGYDLRGDGTSAVVHVNVLNAADTVPIDVIASNANGPGPAAGTSIRYTLAAPSCRISANPAGRVSPGQAVTLTAQCDGSPTSHSWAHGVTGATVVVNPAITASYTLRATNAAGTSVAAVHTVPVSTTAPGLRDYTGHWWAGTTENGWGMTLNQHGQTIFGVIYFYDATGEPTWAVMPAGTWNADFTAWTADMYSPTGSPYASYDAAQLVAGAPTGNITLTFAGASTITASYRLGYSQFDPSGQSITTFGQKTLSPLILNEGASPSGLVVPDMWWGGAAQNGWGISVNQRASEIFAAWFTYGADRRPTWFIVSGNTWAGSTLNAAILRVTGSPWLGVLYNPAAVQSSAVGQATITFANGAAGTFNYTIGAVAGSKAISRQGF